jgi:hypothetical protein
MWPISSGAEATTASATAVATVERRSAAAESAVNVTIAAASRTMSKSNARR